jgi:phosphate transport system protein
VVPASHPCCRRTSCAAQLASGLLRKSLDAFARLDPAAGILILKEDKLLDREFRVIVDKIVAWMTSDPAVIPAAIDLLFVAKAVERIGDHAKNIAEVTIYVVNGTDVRHTSIEQIESAAR